MQEISPFSLGLISGLSISFVFYWVIRSQINAWKSTAQSYKSERDDLQLKAEQTAQLEAKNLVLQERLRFTQQEANQLQAKLQMEFKQMANQLLEEKASKFAQQNQTQVHQILQPLQEKINHFEKRLVDQHESQLKDQSALREYLTHLLQLNQQLGQDTLNLTRALKGDNKTQGNWGELILERVLEKSGLEKGREYDVQYSTVNSEGFRLMPDVVLHLPDGKKIIIDSKVSLTAYERARNATDAPLQQLERKALGLSIKKHIATLADKAYWQAFAPHTPDFVLLFVPIEPALAWALEDDPDLYETAFMKHIVLVSPSTLLATLRTIESIWRQHKQQVNAQEIAGMAAKIYDKFHGVVTDFERVGRRLDDSKEAYEAAWTKLSRGKGNMISQVEKLKTLGVQPKKQLPESDSEENSHTKISGQ